MKDEFINQLMEFSDGDLLAMADILEEINSLELLSSEYPEETVLFWEDLKKNSVDIPKWKRSSGFFKELAEFFSLQKNEKPDHRVIHQWVTHLRKWFTDHDALSLEIVEQETVTVEKDVEPSFEFSMEDEKKLDYSGLIEDPKILETYIQEASEFLDNAQFALLDLEYSSADSESINVVFRCFHTIKSSSAFLGIKNVEILAHYMENMLGLVRKGDMTVTGDLVDLLFFGIGFLRDMVQSIVSSDFKKEKIIIALKGHKIYSFVNLIEQIVKQHKSRKLGQILVEMGKIDSDLISQILKRQGDETEPKKFGEIAVEEKMITNDDLHQAVNEQEKSRLRSSFVRVSADRLNTLVDMVGELVVNQSMLHEQLNQNYGKVTERSLQQLEMITTSIKNIALSMGMVPISETFQKLRVVVRNTARELGKNVSFNMSGEDTELDRKLIEAVYDPLVHIVRNSVSHGIEMPDRRESLGKVSTGQVFITARHKGNGIEILVEDDGGGIDPEKVFNKALSMGLVHEEERTAYLDQPKKCYPLLFRPGFSTKNEADSISGRGVGLDVVVSNLQRINGKVDISSEPGKGSSFSIKLPLTLAIIDGFVMSVNNERFIIPFNVIAEILVPEDVEKNELDNGAVMVRFRDKYVPVLDLRTLFEKRGDAASSEQVYSDKERPVAKVVNVEILSSNNQTVMGSPSDDTVTESAPADDPVKEGFTPGGVAAESSSADDPVEKDLSSNGTTAESSSADDPEKDVLPDNGAAAESPSSDDPENTVSVTSYTRGSERFVYILISFDDAYYALAVDQVLGKQEIVIKNLNEVLRRQKFFSGGTIFGDGSIGFILDLEEIISVFSEKY